MLQFTVPRMKCGGWANSVLQALVSLPGVMDIQADPPNRRLTVDGTVGADLIIRALAPRDRSPPSGRREVVLGSL